MTTTIHDLDVYAEAWQKVLRRTDTSGQCWIWMGALSDGYGRVWVRDHVELAHRVAVMASGREIPVGMHVDHRCHNLYECVAAYAVCPHRRCVNPSHLEVVTAAENMHRHLDAGLCRYGHNLSALNNGTGWRVCVTCRRAARRRRWAARVAARGEAS